MTKHSYHAQYFLKVLRHDTNYFNLLWHFINTLFYLELTFLLYQLEWVAFLFPSSSIILPGIFSGCFIHITIATFLPRWELDIKKIFLPTLNLSIFKVLLHVHITKSFSLPLHSLSINRTVRKCPCLKVIREGAYLVCRIQKWRPPVGQHWWGQSPRVIALIFFNEFRIFFLKFIVISIGHSRGHLHQKNHKKET